MSDPADDNLPSHVARRSRPVLRACLLTAAAAFGAMVPALLPVDLTRYYKAETRIELPVLSKAEQESFLAQARHTLATQAFLDEALQRIAASLPASPDTGKQSALGFLSDLATRRDVRPSATERLERSRLAEQVALSGPASDRRLTVTVRDPDAERAVASANAIADLLVSADQDHPPTESAAVRSARQTLEKMQAELEASAVSDQELEALKTQETGRSELAAERAALEASQAALEEKAALLAQLQPQSVLQNAVSDELAGTGLEEARRRYQEARLQVEQLSVSLGPRHPRLVAAKATEDEARAAIAATLQRAVAGAKQQQDGVRVQLQDLAKRQADLEAQPVSEAARQRLALESRLDAARLVYLDALRLAEQVPHTGPSLTRLDRATIGTTEASGLPAWLYALISALAALCLAGAALPGRNADDEQEEMPVEGAASDRTAHVEPRFADLPIAGDPVRPDRIRFATPSDIGADDPVESLPSLDAMERTVEPLSPPMPSFDEYYQPKPAGHSLSPGLDALAAQVANDAGPRRFDDDTLLETLFSNRMMASPQQPLPVLLASILSRRQLATASWEQLAQTEDERDMRELKRGIEALRRQVEEQLADREEVVPRRYAAGR